MPKAPAPDPAPEPKPPRRRSIDWRKFGARSADEGDRLAWRPAKLKDTIGGTLSRADEVQTRFGSKILIELDGCTGVVASGDNAETEDGDYVVWTTPGLVAALDEAEADKGDYVVITLVELLDTGKGNPFKRFAATVGESPL